ncbi:MAG: aspartate 1-decarboxylase [Armatimonadetes bacterium]|nr:aspartate 1-decarboxylase [Armatimonadota bacterium]
MKLVCRLKSKIHLATITDAREDYIGSLAIDQDAMQASGIEPGEYIHVWVVESGERFSTYAIPAPSGSGAFAVYGAAAHKARRGQKVIIAAFTWTDEKVDPQMILMDDDNKIAQRLPFIAQPVPSR